MRPRMPTADDANQAPVIGWGWSLPVPDHQQGEVSRLAVVVALARVPHQPSTMPPQTPDHSLLQATHGAQPHKRGAKRLA